MNDVVAQIAELAGQVSDLRILVGALLLLVAVQLGAAVALWSVVWRMRPTMARDIADAGAHARAERRLREARLARRRERCGTGEVRMPAQ